MAFNFNVRRYNKGGTYSGCVVELEYAPLHDAAHAG